MIILAVLAILVAGGVVMELGGKHWSPACIYNFGVFIGFAVCVVVLLCSQNIK